MPYLGDGKTGQGDFATTGKSEAIRTLARLDVGDADAGNEHAGVAGNFDGIAGGVTDGSAGDADVGRLSGFDLVTSAARRANDAVKKGHRAGDILADGDVILVAGGDQKAADLRANFSRLE